MADIRKGIDLSATLMSDPTLKLNDSLLLLIKGDNYSDPILDSYETFIEDYKEEPKNKDVSYNNTIKSTNISYFDGSVVQVWDNSSVELMLMGSLGDITVFFNVSSGVFAGQDLSTISNQQFIEQIDNPNAILVATENLDAPPDYIQIRVDATAVNYIVPSPEPILNITLEGDTKNLKRAYLGLNAQKVFKTYDFVNLKNNLRKGLKSRL